MRTTTLTAMTLIALGLSGCSLWSKSEPADTSVQSDASLRTTPQQDYQFASQTYDVNVYDSANKYAGYTVEFYNTSPSYAPVTYSDPRQTEFVKLNGESEVWDWKNCETLNRGYLFISEDDFTLNPGFEVCMRNKGYVLSAEYGSPSKQGLSAQTAGLRGGFTQPQSAPQRTTSAYPGFFN